MTIHINGCKDADELFCQYLMQNKPQPAYIEVDLVNGLLTADYDSEIGTGTPDSVRYGFDRQFPIPILTGNAANRVLNEIAPLAERMISDWEKVWDGENHVAVLGDDAQAAEEEIDAVLGLVMERDGYSEPNQGFDESDLVTVWDVDSATNGLEASEYNITAETTNERLDAIAVEIANELVTVSPSGVIAVPGLHRYLRNLRDDLEKKDTE